MLDEFLDYYKNNLTTYSLVFKYMKPIYTLSTYLLILLLISGYVTVLTAPLIIVGIKIVYSVSILFGLALGLSILVINIISKKAKQIIRAHYTIDVKKGIWRTAEFDTLQIQLLINYLKSKGVYSKEKLESLIKLLEKEIERSKTPSFLAPSIFLALFIPAWSQYVIFLFKGIEGHRTSEAILLIAALVLTIFFIALSVGTFKKIVHFAEDFFMIERNIKKKFLIKIEDLLLRYCDDEEANNRRESSLILVRSKR
jgi:hypothetical protein